MEMATSVESYKQQLQTQQQTHEAQTAELNNRIEQMRQQAQLQGQELEKALKAEVGLVFNGHLHLYFCCFGVFCFMKSDICFRLTKSRHK